MSGNEASNIERNESSKPDQATQNQPNNPQTTPDMKAITKRSLIPAAIAVIVTSTAFADDPQLQNRLALERARNEQASGTTVAVYAKDRGVGHSQTQAVKTESRFELRYNQHGQAFGSFVPANK
jgi:hypothetical protein